MIRSLSYSFIHASIATVLILSLVTVLDAQVMQSSNYQLEADSVNFGGGFSTSSNYRQESTFGEVATGIGTSTNYNLYAGYQQMLGSYIAISGSADVVLSPTLGGVSGGESNGSTTVTVTTDSAAGYRLTFETATSPAMQSITDTIPNYDPGTDPDFSFAVGTGEAFFGYSPEGTDIVQRFQDNGALCNILGGDTELACWDGVSTTAVTIAEASGPNHPLGATTSLRFRVGLGSGSVQPPGVYIATTTLTAVAL